MTISYHTSDINGVRIFYREAGNPSAPSLLLLHGFPSSSHMFRDLIPLLAERFHLIAPDFPGFGQSDMPERSKYQYTFANLADTVGEFTEKIGLKKFAIYIFDYGAPVGLGIAPRNGIGSRFQGDSRGTNAVWTLSDLRIWNSAGAVRLGKGIEVAQA